MQFIKKSWILLVVCLWGMSPDVKSQTDLQISKAFEQYGQRKGSVMVEMTNEALGDYNFALFKKPDDKKQPASGRFYPQVFDERRTGCKESETSSSQRGGLLRFTFSCPAKEPITG